MLEPVGSENLKNNRFVWVENFCFLLFWEPVGFDNFILLWFFGRRLGLKKGVSTTSRIAIPTTGIVITFLEMSEPVGSEN